MKGHQSRVLHIDWSADGEYIQSNSQAYELLYHSIDNGTQITNISSLRDVEWYTWTCVLGWPVQGIWPPCASGDDINSCDVDKTKRVIVTSDDYITEITIEKEFMQKFGMNVNDKITYEEFCDAIRNNKLIDKKNNLI